MIVTDIKNLSFGGTNIQIPQDSHLFERFYCSSHQDCKLKVLCTKKNFEPALMCVKCIIDSEILKLVKNEQMLPIHDVINKAISENQSDIRIDLVKETAEQKLTELTFRDYAGAYGQHAQVQMKKLDREIEKVKESLDELRFQFNQIFQKQSIDLRNREEELKKRFKEFIEEQERIKRLNGATLMDIVDTIQQMNNVEEYERLLKAAYHRSSYATGMNGNLGLKDLLNETNDFKNRVHLMKSCKIDTSQIEEIRKKIDSIEMLDQSLQALPINLNPKLNQTLEKILNAQKTKLPTFEKTDKMDLGHDEAEKSKQKKIDFSESSQGRAIDSGKKKVKDFEMVIESPTRITDDLENAEQQYDQGSDQQDLMMSDGTIMYSKAPGVGTQTPKFKTIAKKKKYSERSLRGSDSQESFEEYIMYPTVSSWKKKKGFALDEVHDEIYYDEDETAYHRTGGNSPFSPPAQGKSERSPQGLYDWINRRVTGYLIFHNTMHDGKVEKEKESDHFNHIIGEKWHELSKLEREEYINLALKTRVKLKREFKDVDLESPEASELQEIIDEMLKKINKE